MTTEAKFRQTVGRRRGERVDYVPAFSGYGQEQLRQCCVQISVISTPKRLCKLSTAKTGALHSIVNPSFMKVTRHFWCQ